MLPSSTKPGDDPLGLVRAYRFRLRRRHHLVSAQKLPRVLSTLSSEATHRRLGEHSPGDEVVELTDTGAPCPIIRVVDHRALENRL